MLAVLLVVALVAVLSFANGANDNSKGVATLVGFGAATARQALLWAMVTTALGAAFSFLVAGGLIEVFKANLFLPGTPISNGFFASVLIGSVGWLIIATYSGLPVSTTHAIVGGLIGAGLVSLGRHQIVWSFLGRGVAIPLLLGPILSTLLVYLLVWPIRSVARRYAQRCVCIQMEPQASALVGARGAAVAQAGGAMAVKVGTETECTSAAPVLAMTSSKTANAIHWTSSGMVGFARGWNDAPKIAALGIVAMTATNVKSPAAAAFALVTITMALGGYMAGRRVLETLARKLTPLPLAESLTASLTTAALVSAASWAALPVSTTHVATGAIVGAGLKNDPKAVRCSKVSEIAMSWVITLPVAGIIAAAAMELIRAYGGAGILH